MTSLLKNKSGVVTGSTSGIGLGIAPALAVFLCGDAAKSIAGAAIPIDGGWSAR